MKTKTLHIVFLLAILFMAIFALTFKPAGATAEIGTITVPVDYQKIQDAVHWLTDAREHVETFAVDSVRRMTADLEAGHAQ